MGGHKQTFETLVPKSEAEAFFKLLGEGLGRGALTFGDTAFDLDGFRSLKLSVKDQGDSYALRLKVKHPKQTGVPFEPSFFSDDNEDEDETSQDAGSVVDKDARPPYEILKERMDGAWNAILKTLEAGHPVEAPLLEAFVRDAELMLTYRGKGDESHERFADRLAAFASAASDGRTVAAAQLAHELDSLKKECHSRYK